MAFLKSRRKTKLKLKEAEEQIKSLNNEVKSLQQSNVQLQKELALSRDKVDELAAKLHDSISEKSVVFNDAGEDSSIKVEVDKEDVQGHTNITDNNQDEELHDNVNNTDSNQGECKIEKLSVSFAADESDEEKLLKLLPKSTTVNSDQEPDIPQTNEELQAKVISLTQEVDKLVTLLAKERGKSKRRRDEAKERRKRFKDKISNMNERLKEDFGDEQAVDDEESMDEKENKEQQKC